MNMALDKETPFTTAARSVDYVSADQEYGKMIKFLSSLPQPTKRHVTEFLYPFYVYVYIYLLSEGKLADAQKFSSTYASLYLKTDGFEKAIKSLFELKTIQDVQLHSYFKHFCDRKYVVKVSKDSLTCFVSFLQEIKSTVLLSILFSHLHVEDIKDDELPSSDPGSFAADAPPVVQETKIPVQSISESNVEIRKSSLKMPSNYLYTITDSQSRLCIADISSKSGILACGFYNSTIHLRNLLPDIMSSNKNKYSTKYSLEDSKESQASAFESKTVFCSSPVKILHGHGGSIFGLAFTSNNELLMTCSEDGTARAWNLKSHTTVAVYSDHNSPVWDIAVRYDSTYFATASTDLAHVWCFERSEPLRTLVGHSADVRCVKFHPSAKYVVTASSDKTIRLWTVQDARSVRLFSGHDSCISCIAFSPNGCLMASADDSGCIKIWDIGSNQQVNGFQAHQNGILSIAYNRKGSILASGGFDNYLKVWDVACSTDVKKSETENLSRNVNFPSIGVVGQDSTLHLVSFVKSNLLLSVQQNETMLTD